MTFREEKYAARQDLHQALSEPAFYFERRAVARKTVTVRLHLHFNAMGDLRNGGFAEFSEKTPEAVFWIVDGFTPVQNAFLVTKTEGVFQLGPTDPVDGPTRKAKLIALDHASAKKLGWDPSLVWCGEKGPYPVS